MRLLILQVSDTHVRDSRSTFGQYADAISDAVRNLDSPLDGCLVLHCGDVTNHGRDDEFLAALDCHDALTKSLLEKLSRDGKEFQIYSQTIPGNHDCLLEPPDTVRAMIIDSLIPGDLSQLDDPAIAALCGRVQNNYFDFAHALGQPVLPPDDLRRLHQLHTISLGQYSIDIHSINTALLSTIREQQGRLAVRVASLPQSRGAANLVVALMHHPYAWLRSDVARTLRDRVERFADLLFTGHEHDATSRSVTTARGDVSTHIEGAALDCDCGAPAGFNACVVDLEARRYHTIPFVLSGKRFERLLGGDAEPPPWLNLARPVAPFVHSDEFRSHLDDTELALTHSGTERVRLSDIYVYPDLRQVNYASGTPGTIVHGEDVVELVVGLPKLLITGDTQSGKSALAKALTTELLEDGFVPILLDGSARLPSEDACEKEVERIFKLQYYKADIEAFRQLDVERRIIIVDDYDRRAMTNTAAYKSLQSLSSHAGHVVLLANELGQGVTQLVTPGADTAFTHFRIQQFGHVRRNRLVDRWLLLSGASERSSPEFVHTLSRVSGVLDTILGKNFVPAFPVYILAVLQATEAAQPVSPTASTHGYFYELLIRHTLSRGRSKPDFDVLFEFLSRLAYAVYESGSAPYFSEELLHTVRQSYASEFGVPLTAGDIERDLVRPDVIRRVDDRLVFSQRYFYYYFIAWRLHKTLNDTSSVQLVRRLASELHVDDSASVLLFLAHLTRDAAFIDVLLEASEQVFGDSDEATLCERTALLPEAEDQPLEITDGDPHVARESVLSAMDRADASQDEPTGGLQLDRSAAQGSVSLLSELNRALKTIQILGQILKNYPGTIDRPRKLAVGSACVGVALRALDFVLDMTSRNRELIVGQIVRSIEVQHPKFTADEAKQRAYATLHGMVRLVAFSMIKRASHAIGAPKLDITYADLVSESPTFARRLVRTSIGLDVSDRFPESDVDALASELDRRQLAFDVLQLLVAEHFYLFPVEYRLKQRVCDLLGFSYKAAQRLDRTQRVLPLPRRQLRSGR